MVCFGRPRSLRFRLTAVATAVVAVVLAATATALITVQQRQLTATLDASLEQRADTIEAELASGVPTGPLPAGDDDRAVQLVGADGSILVTSSNLVGAPPLPNRLSPDEAQAVETRSDLPLDDDDYRVLTRRIVTPAGTGVLHVAEDVEDLQEAIINLGIALGIIMPVIVALLAALIWWLTGRALEPVDTIRAEVDAINATSSRQRLHVPDRADEISRLAVTMNRMLDRLDDGAEKQRRFVADAAHELRTPLTRIRTDVEVDLAQPDHADPASSNNAIRDEVIGLQHLIDDLLQLARSDAGSSDAGQRAVDLDDIVLAEIRQQRTVTDVTLDATRVSAAAVTGNPNQLARAVHNLLTNAVRHANSTVVVTLQERDDHIELTVADNGAGVPPELQGRIFDRFARADDARSRRDGGTGLGLAITKDIIERHDGTIEYDRRSTAGARFVVRLPRRPDTLDH